MRPRAIEPKCERNSCAMNFGGMCGILNSTVFGARGCTFYKEKKENTKKQMKEREDVK